MEFTCLTKEEFTAFALAHEQISFHQSVEWAKLKKTNGWDAFYVGVKRGKKVIAAALLLSKNIFLKQKIFYSPRGFLLHYEDKKLLTFFTKEVSHFVKAKGGFFIKIDPYVPYQKRDINGDIVEGGFRHDEIIESLKNLGYRHYGFNETFDIELQPRFIFWLPVRGKTEELVWNNFSKDTKRHINHAKKELLVLEEVTEDSLDDFCKIMEHTSKRRGFIDRPKSYYKNMIKTFGKNIKILSAVLYVDKALEHWTKEKESLEKEEGEKKKVVEESGSKKSKDALKRVEESLTTVTKKIEELKVLQKTHGSRIVMASSMFLLYGKEVLYLFSGSYDNFMKYNAQYLIQWEMIKYTIEHKYERYNFYGIEGNFDPKNNDTYGVYLFKKGFDGEVVEFLGEFDFIIKKGTYILYKLAFKTYKSLKHLKFQLIRKK